MTRYPPPSETTGETRSAGSNEDKEENRQGGHWEEFLGQQVRISERKQKGFGGTGGMSIWVRETSMRMSVQGRRDGQQDFRFRCWLGDKWGGLRPHRISRGPERRPDRGTTQNMCSSLELQGYRVAVASRTGKLWGSLCVGNRERPTWVPWDGPQPPWICLLGPVLKGETAGTLKYFLCSGSSQGL